MPGTTAQHPRPSAANTRTCPGLGGGRLGGGGSGGGGAPGGRPLPPAFHTALWPPAPHALSSAPAAPRPARPSSSRRPILISVTPTPHLVNTAHKGVKPERTRDVEHLPSAGGTAEPGDRPAFHRLRTCAATMGTN